MLAQIDGDDTDARFPVRVYGPVRTRDVDVSVRFNAQSGEVDRAAGLVARYLDADTYYVTRANALEGHVRLYKVAGGARKQFAGASVPVSTGAWHALGLRVRGAHFEVRFDGRLVFEADDGTLTEAGGAGLWTKADSVTWFDDLRIEPLDDER